MCPTITMASIFELIQPTSPPTPWVRPSFNGRKLVSPAPDFLTPDGNLVPRAIGEAALRNSRAILVGDLLVIGMPDAASRGNW